MNTTTSYSSFLQQNPELVGQALQRYAPPPQQQIQQIQDQATPPQQAQQPPVEQAQQPSVQPQQGQQSQAQQIGHPDSNYDGVNKIAGLIKSQKSGNSGGGIMDKIGSIIGFLA